jgi:hypothetical protein
MRRVVARGTGIDGAAPRQYAAVLDDQRCYISNMASPVVLVGVGFGALALLTAAFARDRDAVYAYLDGDNGVVLTNLPETGRTALFTVALFGDSDDARSRMSTVGPRMGPPEIARLVDAVALSHGIEPELLLAMISTESGFRPRAVSPKGARGLMQLMPGTARRLGVTDPFDPEQNVRGGARYLNELLKLFDNDLKLALAAYNAGEETVIRHGRTIPPFPETRQYVAKVLGRYQALASIR